MAISVRQTKATRTVNATGASVVLDLAPVVGNVLVAGFTAPGTSGVTFSPPDGGWTELADVVASLRRTAIFADVVDAGESSTVTFTGSIADASYGLTVWEIAGLNTSSYLDKSITAVDSGGVDVNLVYGSTGTLVQADEIAILFAGLSGTSGGSHTVTPGTWNIRGEADNTIAVGADRIVSATTALQPTAGWTTARRSYGCLVTLKGAAAGVDPVADAGADQTNVEAFDLVTLSGSASGGNPGYSYSWSQIAGDTVSLVGTGANRTFVAPAKLSSQTLTFRVTVTDSLGGTDTDDVNIGVIGHDRFRRTGGAWVGMDDFRRGSSSWV